MRHILVNYEGLLGDTPFKLQLQYIPDRTKQNKMHTHLPPSPVRKGYVPSRQQKSVSARTAVLAHTTKHACLSSFSLRFFLIPAHVENHDKNHPPPLELCKSDSPPPRPSPLQRASFNQLTLLYSFL